jgi:hypothetical protein
MSFSLLDLTEAKILKAAATVFLEIYSHQDMPFNKNEFYSCIGQNLICSWNSSSSYMCLN